MALRRLRLPRLLIREYWTQPPPEEYAPLNSVTISRRESVNRRVPCTIICVSLISAACTTGAIAQATVEYPTNTSASAMVDCFDRIETLRETGAETTESPCPPGVIGPMVF